MKLRPQRRGADHRRVNLALRWHDAAPSLANWVARDFGEATEINIRHAVSDPRSHSGLLGFTVFPATGSSIAGRPLLQHVWERRQCAKNLDAIIIATDDMRIAAAAFAW